MRPRNCLKKINNKMKTKVKNGAQQKFIKQQNTIRNKLKVWNEKYSLSFSKYIYYAYKFKRNKEYLKIIRSWMHNKLLHTSTLNINALVHKKFIKKSNILKVGSSSFDKLNKKSSLYRFFHDKAQWRLIGRHTAIKMKYTLYIPDDI